jgi:hypothetical protein
MRGNAAHRILIVWAQVPIRGTPRETRILSSEGFFCPYRRLKMEIRTIRQMAFVGAIALLASSICFAQSGGAAMHKTPGKAAATRSAVALRMGMRQLWEEHIVYTRNYIVSGLAGLEDAGKVAERLLRNQDDIGNAIQPFYGEAAGKKLSALLREHILIAADIVTAAKTGDNAGVAAGQKKWHANADDIAVFLSGANPNWPKPVLTDMLYKHLDFTTTEVVSRLKKDWAADIEAYDGGHEHMLMFADALANGIIKQFPRKFSK